MRKQYITDKGKAWGGITIDEPKMLNLAEHILSQTKWKGGLELELIRASDNKLYLLEINPRIPACYLGGSYKFLQQVLHSM